MLANLNKNLLVVHNFSELLKGSSDSLTHSFLNHQSNLHDKAEKIGEILEKNGLVTDEDLHLALAEKLRVPFAYLKNFEIDPKALDCLSSELAWQYKVIPLGLIDKDRIAVAMEDPTDNDLIKLLFFVTKKTIEVVVSSRSDIMEAIGRCYGYDVIESTVVDQLNILEGEGEGGEKEREREKHEAERLSQQKPIVKFVNKFIFSAIRHGASDIHIRPNKNDVSLIFRIDGTLVEIYRLSKTTLSGIVSRIKIIGRMNIAVKQIPQDGQSRMEVEGNTVDLRISIIPTIEGESVVIRLLNKQAGLKGLDELGLVDRDLTVLLDLIHRNNGLILVTGPTGSGKSTTLYCLLQEISKQAGNIITIEDPVEYRISGVEQVQVNLAAGLTFARALRNILRHDPDVIMVGEIRDKETAQIAVESALTGHLVLSTLHTNSAAATITRLLEMGIDPYLINATLLGVFTQRLIRLNCPDCLVEENVDNYVRQTLGIDQKEIFYRGNGCSNCNNLGYRGRLATYEFLQMTSAIRHHVYKLANSDKIQALAVREGMLPLTRNALALARQCRTSLAEVYRIRLE